ncbi:hypothetical protein TPR58_22095 [Sphingomonas sp. HF-S3]|uniref:Uncharacterized protein n=1 Tax=Sphingomonas rustica TaxID=3103142 RepID=A0ABV0BF57_9SPHN
MRLLPRIIFFLVGIFQFFAVWDGVAYALGATSFLGKAFAFFVGIILTYIPLIGSAVGVYGATHAWDWSLAKSVLLFFWYVPVFLLMMIGSYFANRRPRGSQL